MNISPIAPMCGNCPHPTAMAIAPMCGGCPTPNSADLKDERSGSAAEALHGVDLLH